MAQIDTIPPSLAPAADHRAGDHAGHDRAPGPRTPARSRVGRHETSATAATRGRSRRAAVGDVVRRGRSSRFQALTPSATPALVGARRGPTPRWHGVASLSTSGAGSFHQGQSRTVTAEWTPVRRRFGVYETSPTGAHVVSAQSATWHGHRCWTPLCVPCNRHRGQHDPGLRYSRRDRHHPAGSATVRIDLDLDRRTRWCDRVLRRRRCIRKRGPGRSCTRRRPTAARRGHHRSPGATVSGFPRGCPRFVRCDGSVGLSAAGRRRSL